MKIKPILMSILLFGTAGVSISAMPNTNFINNSGNTPYIDQSIKPIIVNTFEGCRDLENVTRENLKYPCIDLSEDYKDSQSTDTEGKEDSYNDSFSDENVPPSFREKINIIRDIVRKGGVSSLKPGVQVRNGYVIATQNVTKLSDIPLFRGINM